MLPLYYAQVEQELTEANVGLSNRSFLSEISARVYKIKAKYRTTEGKIDYSRMSPEDLDALSQIAVERKARKSNFDAVTGFRKTGIELQEAQELQRLDEIRANKAQSRDNSREFLMP